MGDGVGLITDQVVEAVCAIGVDEAVADPATCAHTVDVLIISLVGKHLETYLSLMSQTTSKADSAPSSSISPFCTASR